MPNELFHLFIQERCAAFSNRTSVLLCRKCLAEFVWCFPTFGGLSSSWSLEREKWNDIVELINQSYPTLSSWLTLSEVRGEKDKTTFSCEGFAKHFRYLSLSRTMIAISGDLGVKAGSCSSEVLRWQETILLIPSCCKALLAEKSRRQMYVMQSLFCSAWGPKEREW